MSDGHGSPAERAPRSQRSTWRGVPDDGDPRVLRLEPPDKTRGIFRDATIIAFFSHRVDRETVSAETFTVVDEQALVPGGVWTSLDGRFAVWTPRRLLAPGALHCVRLAGLRDLQGRPLAVHESVFVPGDLSLDDLAPVNDGP